MHAEHRKYRMEAELRAFRMILDDSGFSDLPALNCTLLASFRRLLRSSHASAACWYLVSKNTVISFLISKEWSNYGHCHFRILDRWIMLSRRKKSILPSSMQCSGLFEIETAPAGEFPTGWSVIVWLHLLKSRPWCRCPVQTSPPIISRIDLPSIVKRHKKATLQTQTLQNGAYMLLLGVFASCRRIPSATHFSDLHGFVSLMAVN